MVLEAFRLYLGQRGMSNLSKDLVFLVLKFLDEEGYKEAAHS